MLQPLYGGAFARPFVTRHNALDMEFYLRISNELYLKRLIVGGLERVYEFSRDFRNEGMDRTHNPEFTMLEFYQAFADVHDMMDVTEGLDRPRGRALRGALPIAVQGPDAGLPPPWRRLSMLDAVSEKVGESRPRPGPRRSCARLAAAHGVEARPGTGAGGLLDEVFSALVQPELEGPRRSSSTIPARPRRSPGSSRGEPAWSSGSRCSWRGMELANAFSRTERSRRAAPRVRGAGARRAAATRRRR